MGINTSIFLELDSFKTHLRLCHLYYEDTERADLGSQFIAHGIKKKERCIYISDRFIPEEFVFRLSAAGIDIKESIKSGHYRELIISKKVRQKSINDPAAFIDFLNSTVEELLQESNMPIRVLENKATVFFKRNELLRKEALLDQITAEKPLIYMNQYDIRKTNSQDLINLFSTHGQIILNNVLYKSPFYERPDEILVGLNQTASKYDLLTDKEKEVLRYLVNAYSNQKIAEELSISVRTVETHRANIMKKLDINNLVDLVKFAILNGVI